MARIHAPWPPGTSQRVHNDPHCDLGSLYCQELLLNRVSTTTGKSSDQNILLLICLGLQTITIENWFYKIKIFLYTCSDMFSYIVEIHSRKYSFERLKTFFKFIAQTFSMALILSLPIYSAVKVL